MTKRDNLGRFVKGHIGIKNKGRTGMGPTKTSFKKGHHSKTEFKKGTRIGKKYWIKKGEHRSPNTEIKKGQFAKEKHPMWKGGTTSEYKLLISSQKWKKLRLKILKRDNFTCQHCNKKGDSVDHIIPWRINKDNSESNLQLLCRSCNTKKVKKDGEIKVAIVTGNSKGIGKAITNALKKEGIFVYDVSRTTGYNLMTLQGLNKIQKLLSQTDIIINNIGGMGTSTPEEWKDCMQKNYGITQILTRNWLKYKKKWGRVITISSIYGTYPGPNPEFAAVKAAQIMFTKSIADKYKGKITFNCISPSEVADAGKKKKVKLKSKDVANLVAFLCSDEAKFINKQNIVIGE